MPDSRIVTRFAPSPTGSLHLGGARTALFNYMFARHHNGDYLLRIEDTDRARSSAASIEAILEGISWLGIAPSTPPCFQSERQDRHKQEALRLLDAGLAYRSYETHDELASLRAEARKTGRKIRYEGRTRTSPPPQGAPSVIRVRTPERGATQIEDLVQGRIRIANDTLDDFVLLRADGSPSYMLSVVVDDADMGVTHIIRGDDHLVNAARQRVLFDALGYEMPHCAHIPLIHASDGKKLSKRHGAIGIEELRKQGYPPEAVWNYLLRLGWSPPEEHANTLFSLAEAARLFALERIGRNPAQFDPARLDSLSQKSLKNRSAESLLEALAPFFPAINEAPLTCLRILPALAERCSNFAQMARQIEGFVRPPSSFSAQAEKILAARESVDVLTRACEKLGELSETVWTVPNIAQALKEAGGGNFGLLARNVRSAVLGTLNAPDLALCLYALGKQETQTRLKTRLGGQTPPVQQNPEFQNSAPRPAH